MAKPALINNRYRLVEKIGQGGMGAVYKAYDHLEQEEIALKQVTTSPNDLIFGSKPGTDNIDKLRKSLAREFQILAGLRHPYIVSVLDHGFDDKRVPYFTMDYIDGAQNITDYAAVLPRAQQARMLIHTLEALAYLHRRGVIHHDLKPDNILVTAEGTVQVMDFGISRHDQAQSDSTGQEETIRGTFAYMAPELFQGGKASVSSDLFAFGLIAYEILVGKYPFEFKNISMLIVKLMVEIPDTTMLDHPRLAAWLQRLLSKDPAARYPDAHTTMLALYAAMDVPVPAESQQVRESYLQASTFVGRDQELKQLTDALDQIETTNAFFLVGGESGVGKSRLADEFRIEALVHNALVMRGQAVEGGGLPFQLWRDIVRRLLLAVDVTDLQAGILKDIVPDIDTLLGKEIAKAPELTGSAYQQRMVLTIVDLFRKGSQPIVLLLSDLQWVEESLAVLQQMLKMPEQLPKLLVVANYRNDEAPDLPEKLAGMTHITLDRLTPDAVSQLSQAMLGDAGAKEEVVKLLHSQSEGNLFFLVETVRALAESSGALQRIGEGALPEEVFTGGMQALIRRRLSRVNVQYSDLQTLAAIIGREIDKQLLAHAYDETTVEAWLSNASDYGVVSIQENTWHFAHDKLRETIVADIPDDELPKIHRTAAEAIEAVYPDNAGYNEALLAHWQAAGDMAKMYHYLLPVAENMIEIVGTYTNAEAHLHRMLDRLPKDDGRCVALWNWLARSAEKYGKYGTSQHYAEQAQQLATRLNDLKGLITCLNTLGVIANYQGDYDRAIDLFQQSLTLSQQLGDSLKIANSLNALGIIAHYQGDYDRATVLYQQSLGLRQQLGDKHNLAKSLHNLGYTAYAQGQFDRANELYHQSLRLSQQLGAQLTICHNYMELGMVAFRQGGGQASHLFGNALRTAYNIQATPTILWSIVGFAGVLAQEGETERAANYAGLLQSHPAQHSQVRDALTEVMPHLEAALPPEELAAALERGKSLDLDTVVKALLAEFGEEA